MHLSGSEVKPQLPVRHSKQPGKVGVLTGKTMDSIVFMAEVKWGNETTFEPITILELFDTAEDDSFESLVERKRFERIESLRSLMTFEKLNGSLSNVMYSMQTAEIDFFAHQFVPVLKFVNAPLGRLLIADEVGLGKTIEAGLIWTECRARYQARRLIVVCPPTLVPKWIHELRERFAIDAEQVDAKGLEEQLASFKRKGPSHSFALVTSYPSIRLRKNERALLQPWLNFHGTEVEFEGNSDTKNWNAKTRFYRSLLEEDGPNPFFDLTIFDEAHMMKNTATANHLVGDIFSTASQAVLALSATPLTTKTRDLYSLLKLVDPDLFSSENTFNDLRERNVAAVRLASELSRANIDRDQCLSLIKTIPDSVKTIEQLDSLPPNEKDQLAKRCVSYPEVAAGVQPILQSRSVRDAKFITLDVGAGTIDLNVFHRWTKSGKKTLDYWACQVKPLGFARLPSAGRRLNRGEHEISVNTIPENDLMKQVCSSVLSLMQDAFVYQPYESPGDGASPWAGETLAYIWGGGSEYPAYRETLKAALETFDIGVHEINQLPKPNTNLRLPPGLKFGRLAIAFGLSYHHPNLKEIRLPSSLKSYAEIYGLRTTTVTSRRPNRGHQASFENDCSCKGINSGCPNCFGSGTIRKSLKREVNLTALRSITEKRKLAEAEKKLSKKKTQKQRRLTKRETPTEIGRSHQTSGNPVPSADMSQPTGSKEQLQLQKLLDDFKKLPRPIPLVRRVRALNIIQKQSRLLDKNKEQEFLKSVNDFLSQKSGRRGDILIVRGSAEVFSSGCEVIAILTKGKRYEVRILHKNPRQLIQGLNDPRSSLFLKLQCQIMKDRETGDFILRSIPPYQMPIPAQDR